MPRSAIPRRRGCASDAAEHRGEDKGQGMKTALMGFAFGGIVMTWALAAPAAAQCGPDPTEPLDQPVTVTINGEPLDGSELVGGQPRLRKVASGRRIFVMEGTFGPYVIERCPGCPGPARLVIQDNLPLVFCGSDGVNQLVLTDARIRARTDANPAQLSVPLTIEFGTRFQELFGNTYPHGVVMDGTFACRGSGRCVTPVGTRIAVSAFGGMNGVELVKAGGRTTEPSLQFTVSSTRSFAKQAIESIFCNSGGDCAPAGVLEVTIQLGAPGDAVILPGSIAVLSPTLAGDDGLALLIPAMNALLASSAPTGATCGGSTPCACGDTLVASRTLDSDPVVRGVCPGDGLIVGQSDVVLTIRGGNTIRGSGTGTGVLVGAGVNGVTVRSGGVTGFAAGVRAAGNDGGTFSGLVLRGNVEVGLDLTGAGNTIDRVIAETNGVGIAVDGDGNVVSRSRALGSGETGVAATGAGNTVARNVVERSAGRGMGVDGAGARVERNQIGSTGDDGLVVTGTGHLVSRNVIKLTGGDGLAVEAAGGTTVSRNQTDRSGGFGIVETAGAGGTANTYVQNVCGGAALGDSSPGGLCF
jgi:hypothetical protein